MAVRVAAGRRDERDDALPAWRRWYSDYGAAAGYALAALALYVGWAGHVDRNIDAKYGLGYALGIIGGSLMLLLLLYSVRKRVALLNRFGATRHWFRGHMMLGIVGPLVIMFHCNFKLGDLNSRIALYCTLLVAGSGIIGRYLYAGFHNGLYGSRATLREISERLKRAPSNTGPASALLAGLRAELAVLDQRVLSEPHSIVETLVRPVAVSWRAHRLESVLRRKVHQQLVAGAAQSSALKAHAGRLEAVIEDYLADHLAQVRQVARFNAFERLFAFWHVIHIPFFFMLVISAIVHVIAVHLY